MLFVKISWKKATLRGNKVSSLQKTGYFYHLHYFVAFPFSKILVVSHAGFVMIITIISFKKKCCRHNKPLHLCWLYEALPKQPTVLCIYSPDIFYFTPKWKYPITLVYFFGWKSSWNGSGHEILVNNLIIDLSPCVFAYKQLN